MASDAAYQRRWRERNPEKVKAENLKRREYKKQWYEKNRERELKKHREYNQKHQVELREKRRVWREKNKEALAYAAKAGIGLRKAREVLAELDRKREQKNAKAERNILSCIV